MALVMESRWGAKLKDALYPISTTIAILIMQQCRTSLLIRGWRRVMAILGATTFSTFRKKLFLATYWSDINQDLSQ